MIPFTGNYKLLVAKLVIIIGYGISIPGLWMMRDTPDVFQLSWMFSTLTIIILLLFHKPFSWNFLMAILAVGIIGWSVEAIGTNTGLLFGSYAYGPSLGPKLLRTPLAMVVNWMMPIYLITMALRSKIVNIWRLGFAGALLMVIYDILLEPVAIRLDMWSWGSSIPPLQNYIVWFIVSFPLVMLLGKYVRKSNNPLTTIAFVCQLLFFTGINLMMVFGGF